MITNKMVNVIFLFNEEKSVMQCEKNDKLIDICKNYVSKIGNNINKLYFIYNGNQVNLELTFDEHVDSIDRNLNEMKILVHEKNKTIDIDEMKQSREIICPKCNESCFINIRDYKIKLYDCKSGHNTSNLLLDEYDKTQNINQSKIICSNCDISKSYKHDNIFYKCITCKQYLCPLCISVHNGHKIIDYEKINYTCHIHKHLFFAYCSECKRNICKSCQKEHNEHKILFYKDLLPNENAIKEQLVEFRKKVDKFNNNLRQIMKLLNKVIDNMELFYKINCDIVNNYDPKNTNYQTIQNLNEMQNFIRGNDIDEIINDNNIYNKFQNILNIYNKMSDKNLYSDIVENNTNKEKENSKKNNGLNDDSIIIRYKVNTKDSPNIKIFDKYFINNNKKNCKFICEDKSYELTEYLNMSNFKIDKDILEIKLTGINNITNMSYIFCGCSSLVSLPNIDKWNPKDITNMKYMFTGCSSLSSLPDISKWNTNNVVNMSYLFDTCSALKTLPDISKWNTDNVKNMNSMFCGCSSLISLPDISKWNTNNVTNMSYMFCGCKSLLSIPNISKWTTINLTNISYMFDGCSSLKTLPDISKWQTNNLTTIIYIFCGCSSLKSLPDISRWNTSNITDMSSIFYGCESLTIIPDISKWNTSNVTDMSKMLCGCKSLSNIPDISKWNINNVTNLSNLFCGCSSLKYIPSITKWNTNNVKDMSKMFCECSSITTLPDLSKINTSNVTDMNKMFCDCVSLKSLRDISEWNTANVTNMSYMFFGCKSLTSLPDISKWNTANVTDMNYMFCGCKSLTSISDISRWNVKKAKNNKNCMFKYCKDTLNIPAKFKQ